MSDDPPSFRMTAEGTDGFDVLIGPVVRAGTTSQGDVALLQCLGEVLGQSTTFMVAIPVAYLSLLRQGLDEAEARCLAAHQQSGEHSQPESLPTTDPTQPARQDH